MSDEYEHLVEDVKDLRYQVKLMKGIVEQLVCVIIPAVSEYETCDCEDCQEDETPVKNNYPVMYNNT